MSERAVIFDLGNVLFQFDLEQVAEALASRLDVTMTPRELMTAFYGSPQVRQLEVGKIDADQFFQSLRDQWQLTLPDDQLRRLWADRFTAIPAMHMMVRELRQHKRYLLSDTNPVDFQWIYQLDPTLFAQFDALFLSHQQGVTKKSEQAWHNVLAESRLSPQMHLFIDDRADYVERARGLGLQGIHFQGDVSTVRRQLEELGYL